MDDLKEKIAMAIDRIQSFESLTHHFADDGTDGYYLAFSGGKDSVVNISAGISGRLRKC